MQVKIPLPHVRFGPRPPGDLFIIGREAHFDGGTFQFTATVIGGSASCNQLIDYEFRSVFVGPITIARGERVRRHIKHEMRRAKLKRR